MKSDIINDIYELFFLFSVVPSTLKWIELSWDILRPKNLVKKYILSLTESNGD